MKVRINRSGKIFIGVTILLGVAAANTANNLLYLVVSSMLSLMLVSGIYSILNLRGVKVTVVPPPEIFAKTPARLKIVVYKESRFPSFLIEVLSWESAYFFPLVGSDPAQGYVTYTFKRRGRADRITLVISSSFPLGMFTRENWIELETDIVVFPKPEKVRPREMERLLSETEGSKPRLGSKGYEDIKDLRDYRGDPIKLIHWKVSAKRGELMVKNMEGETAPPLILTLDMVEGTLEERLSKLTYLTSELMNRGHPVGLKLGDAFIPPGRGTAHKRKILRELALYGA